jgi:hypothetical protein
MPTRHNARTLSISVLLCLVACTGSNPDSCVTTPSICEMGTRCVRGIDERGHGWSACLPYDGGASSGASDAEERPDAPSRPVDAPEDRDREASDDTNTFADTSGQLTIDSKSPETGTDVGFGATCAPQASRSCAVDGFLGNCAKGLETCTDGKWGVCAIPPQATDRCDAIGDDANCNGQPNEGCSCVTGDQQACGPSIEQGICKRGIQTCTNAKWGVCQGATYAKPRDCRSSSDNDCDGRPDDAIDSTCRCTEGKGQTCDSHPQDGIGACRAGTQHCIVAPNGALADWSVCANSVAPTGTDTCAAGNDANCNGIPNENCKALGQSCALNSDCLSGFCVQGTCCNSSCPTSGPSTCGNDGTCDITGSCRKYANGTTCTAANCSDRASSRESSTCQGGVCQTGKMCDYHGCGTNSRCAAICPAGYLDSGTSCEACGDSGQECCGGNTCNSTGLGCIRSMVDGMLYCGVCGGLGNRCCSVGTQCREGMCLPAAAGGSACQSCGLSGQPCCANMQCSQGNCSAMPNGHLYCQ